MTTMKKRVLLFGIAFGIIALASCSNDDNAREEKEETQTVQFRITEEGFGADTELTRATVTDQPQIIAAGDCEAEVSIENTPSEKQTATRAVTTPVHYTIRAYHNGTLRGEMKGTFTPTGFTPDAGYSAQMKLGKNHTYDFVCFNDQVTPNGNNLDITLANAATARIGRQTIAIGATDQTINLSSKHVGCRIQTQVVAKKDIPTAMTSTIESIGATVAQSVSYDLTTDTYTPTATAAMPATTNNSPTSAETKYWASNFGQTYSYTSSAPYLYFLPGMDAANLKLNNLSGTIFWKPFSMNIAKLSTATKILEANGSYTIKIKMKPQFTYLMSDGSIGLFRQTTFGGGAKTPIAVVINQDKKLAVALRDAGKCKWTLRLSSTWQSQHQIFNRADMLTTENGYAETWDAAETAIPQVVKATSTDFPAFKAVGDYTPGVSVSGSLVGKRWYLPSTGEWKYAYLLGCGDPSGLAQIHNDWQKYYGYLADIAFTQVGGTAIAEKTFWASTEYFTKATVFAMDSNAAILSYGYKDVDHCARAFIKY